MTSASSLQLQQLLLLLAVVALLLEQHHISLLNLSTSPQLLQLGGASDAPHQEETGAELLQDTSVTVSPPPLTRWHCAATGTDLGSSGGGEEPQGRTGRRYNIYTGKILRETSNLNPLQSSNVQYSKFRGISAVNLWSFRYHQYFLLSHCP